MAIFPVSPTVGQEETVLGRTFVYDGYGWVVKVSGGHTILDPDENTMPTQPALQFGSGFTVTDETGKTVVGNTTASHIDGADEAKHGPNQIAGLIPTTNIAPTPALKFDKNYWPDETRQFDLTAGNITLSLDSEVTNIVGFCNFFDVVADGVHSINLGAGFKTNGVFPPDLSGKILDISTYLVRCIYSSNGIVIEIPALMAGGAVPPAATITGVITTGLNNYVDVIFSEGVYGNDTQTVPVNVADLRITNFVDGGVTAIEITSITKSNGDALEGGESVIRCQLGLTGTPLGIETFEIQPVDSLSIFSESGVSVSAAQKTGVITLLIEDELILEFQTNSPSTTTFNPVFNIEGGGVLRWDFGDGTTFDGNMVSKTFTDNTIKTVRIYKNTILSAASIRAVNLKSDHLIGNIDFSKLTGITSSFDISYNPALTGIVAPSGVFNVFLINNCNLTGILDISSVTGLGGYVSFENNPNLTGILFPNSSESITSLTLSSCNITGVLNMSGLTGLRDVVTITVNPNLTNIVFPPTSSAITTLNIYSNNLTGTLDLTPLTGLGGLIDISTNSDLTNILFPVSSQIVTSVKVEWCNLSTLDLSSMTGFGGALRVRYNTMLSSIILPESTRTLTTFLATGIPVKRINFSAMPNALNVNNATYTMTGWDVDSDDIDYNLQQLSMAVTTTTTGGTINMIATKNGVGPSAAGLEYKTALEAKGLTVLVDETISSPVKRATEDGGLISWDLRNTTWNYWSTPQIANKNGLNYTALLGPSGRVCVYRLQEYTYKMYEIITGYNKDDHNTPAILLRDNYVLLAYTGHVEDNKMHIVRIENDLSDKYNTDTVVNFGAQLTYSQLIEIGANIYLFTRYGLYSWAYIYSGDDGLTWSAPKIFIASVTSQKLYMSCKKHGAGAIVGIYSHPTEALANNVFHLLTIDENGEVHDDGSPVGNLLTTVELDTFGLHQYRTVTTGDGFRFLDLIENLGNIYVLWADFTNIGGDYNGGDYVLQKITLSTSISTEYVIVAHGADTYPTYFGGGCFDNADGAWNNKILLSREDDGIYYLEEYTFNGSVFAMTDLIEQLTATGGTSLKQPIVDQNKVSSGIQRIHKNGNDYNSYTNWANTIKVR